MKVMLKECNVPNGVFQNVNFMTPNIRAYYKLKKGYAELSEGVGMHAEPIFGVTVRSYLGERFNPDPSNLYFSRKTALDAITELS